MKTPPKPAELAKWFPETWSDIVGNSSLVTHWKNMIQRGTCNSLFTGPSRTGKTRTIYLGIQALMCPCRNENLDPCGACDACKMVREDRQSHWGIYSALSGSEYSFHAFDCERMTKDDLDELWENGDLRSDRTIVYLDEVAALRSKKLEGSLLKLIDETEATWIASAISVRRKKGKRKGEYTERLRPETRFRFPAKCGTAVPHPDDLERWLLRKAEEWQITIRDPEVTIPLITKRTSQRVGIVMNLLAYAATRAARDLNPVTVNEFDFDALD